MDSLSSGARIPWKPIEALSSSDRVVNGSIAALNALREAWQSYLDTLSERDKTAIRERTLRRLSIETGILERLYDIDWGLTLSLVAEGFARDVVERAGGQLDDRVIITLRAQMETLGLVLDFVREARQLTPGFIKQLHSSITRTQPTYTAVDALGRTFEAELPHGVWKSSPNHVQRADGTILEYTPPEQVASEIDRLVDMSATLEQQAVHPVVMAAWLHHRFVQIHPFADGNGRVARALNVLVLEKYRYAPLVVDRFHRGDYIAALDAANQGTLKELIKLFIRLENSALAGELERPSPQVGAGLSSEVAHTLAEQLQAQQARRSQNVRDASRRLAIAVLARLKHWFDTKSEELRMIFKERQLTNVVLRADHAHPGDPRAAWFKRQVIHSAKTSGHYADFSPLVSWSRLKIKSGDLELWFVASLHGVGKGGGVMGVTTFAEIRLRSEIVAEPEPESEPLKDYVETTKDAFLFVHAEAINELNARSGELEGLLDEGLTEALTRLLREV